MSAASSAGYPVGQSCDNDHGMIDLDVRTLTGEEFRLRVERSTRGAEVRKMVLDHLPGRSGAKLVLDHVRHQTSEQGVEETVRLKLHQALHEQGFTEAETAILCCTYVPTQLQAAWRFLMGLETAEAELSLEGVTHLTTPSPLCLLHLPQSLISLTFAPIVNESLERVTFPNSLQSLTFGERFNQSLERVTLPNSLQNLTFGEDFNQSLEGSLERVTLPNSLQNLTFGDDFNQSLERVTLPNSLQSLTFGERFNQSLEGVTLPNSLQSLTFGERFNQSLEGVTLPNGLQSLIFGFDFNQSLEGVTLPNSLQSLTFGLRFNQSLERVTLPNSLQNLTFGRDFNQSLARVTLEAQLILQGVPAQWRQMAIDDCEIPLAKLGCQGSWQRAKMGALCSCEEGEDAAPDQQEEEVKDLSEDFAAKKATLEDQKRISDDRAKRMDENWKQTQAIMRHVHRMPPLRTQHFVQASAPSVAVNQMYPRVVSGYAPAVPLQRPLAAPAPRMLRSGPQLPRMLRVGPVAVQVMEEPSMQSKRLPWVVQEPGQVVLTSGATHGEWVQLLFAHSRKGWAPLRSFMSEPRGGMHGDGMYDGLDRAICSHQSVPTDCGSSEARMG
eukprot:symbB.v1.2.002629.t2/scaffold139.1/size300179/12